MKIRLVAKANPSKREEFKFYANPVNMGKKTIRDIAREIAGRSSLTRGDIENVLSNFLDELPEYLKDGFSVQLGEFGTMRLSLSSQGAPTADPKTFPTSSIKPKVIFTPSKMLKDDLAKNSYEIFKDKK